MNGQNNIKNWGNNQNNNSWKSNNNKKDSKEIRDLTFQLSRIANLLEEMLDAQHE